MPIISHVCTPGEWCNVCDWNAGRGGTPKPAASRIQPPVQPPAPPATPCAHRGERVSLPGVQGWFECGHPERPLGNPVCPCKGCGPRCSGYTEEAPEVTIGDAPTVTPQRPFLVCTVAVGDTGAAMLEATGPLMRRYAERVGADFAAITGPTLNPYVLADKFRLHHLTPHYERLLFLDADALIHPDAPDLFRLVPPGQVAIRDDSPELSLDLKPDVIHTAASQGVTLPPFSRSLNSGVVLWCKDQPVWTPPYHPLPPTHIAEQCWVQANIERHGLPVFPLGREWNHQWWTDRSLSEASEAHVLHLAGMSQTDTVAGWKMNPTATRSVLLRAAAWAANRRDDNG